MMNGRTITINGRTIYGYVELNADGMNLVGVTSPGPYPVIDMDERFGVEILDRKNTSHWIMKMNYTVLDGKTIESMKHEPDPFNVIQEGIKILEIDAKLDGILVSLSNEERIRLHEKLNVGAIR